MKKIALILIVLSGLFLIGCNNENTEPTEDFSYYEEYLSENPDYNTNLFYLNDLGFQVADPSVIYVDEGDQAGYFYVYGTSDDIRALGFQSWRSTDLTHWESMGVAFKPDFNETWANVNYWAPEVIYDEADGLYYMFYSAQSADDGTFHLSVAYSENPEGPYITPNNIRNGNGVTLTLDKPVYNVQIDNTRIDSDIVRLNAIDISPFIDPVTNERYIYFSYYDSFNQSELFGIKMSNWFTPDYSTLTQLTAVGYQTVEASLTHDPTMTTPEGTINEGPFMLYEDGTYYLTYSVYGFTDEKYQVRQALSDDPLGTFTKYTPEQGGTVLATDPNWAHITSSGHHSFIYVGDEIFIAYHTFFNRTDITNGRALAVDKVEFVEYDGVKLLHSNGPTYSLQPLPEEISGYKNVAVDATITANNTSEDSDISYLNDGIMSYLTYDIIPEYVANEGVSKITLTWDDFVSARAVMIYNSINYDDSFMNIAKISMTYLADDEGNTGIVEMNSLNYDWDWNVDSTFAEMNPGGAIIAEFDELSINKIEITFASIVGCNVAIPEIVVLGKSESVAVNNEWTDYSYTNPEFGSPDLINEGETVGSNNGLHTNFGYDLTHDDGTEDAYITQTWAFDQFAYLTDIYATSFYVEAEFTVTNDESYVNDLYPKFGLTVATEENTIFYFVDANSTYTKDAVGVAQRTFDNSDWDWNTTEQNVSNTGISYKDGDYVKLTIIRNGDEFYMLANDRLLIYYDNFNIFVENYSAAVGFLTFNTEVKIKNYFATEEQEFIAEKLDLYETQVNGETFGITGDYKTTSGWDLTTDTDLEDAYVINYNPGDQYMYFRDYEDSYFYAETKITVVAGLGDSYPKFGLVLRSGDSQFFYFINSNTSFNAQSVGYVMKNVNGWDWNNSQTFSVSDMNYSNDGYATLGLLYDEGTITLYMNGVLITTLQDAAGFISSDCVVGILSFTTSVKVTDYILLTDSTEIDDLLNQ